MSAETIKFFEDKSTEEIINWMIQNLTEEQIKLCLDSADIKPQVTESPSAQQETTLQESSAASTSVAGSSSDTLPASLEQATSSVTDVSDMFSGMNVVPASVGKATTKQDMSVRMLNGLRKRCLKRPYILVSIEKPEVGQRIIKYYDFNLIEEEDLILNPTAIVGDVNWMLKTKPQYEFVKEHCNEEDKESLEELLSFDETTSEKYNNPPPVVVEVIKEYLSQGIDSPISGLDLSKLEKTPSTPFRFNDTLKKALLRQKTTCKTMQKDYPLLYSKNLKSVPFFIYDYEGDTTIKFYYAKFEEGSLKFIDEKKPLANLPLVFKMRTTALEKEIANGNYNTDDIQIELQNLVNTLPPPVWDQLTNLYNKQFLGNLTSFGMEHHEWDTLDDLEDLSSDVSPAEIEMPELKNLNITKPKTKKGIARQIADGELTEEQIKQHLYKLFGKRAENLTYELYHPVNSPPDTIQIKYITLDKSSLIDPEFDAELIEEDKFTEFQGSPSVNSGPGRFGEDEDEPLLFGNNLLQYDLSDVVPEPSNKLKN
jgi:hypothetical protein